LFFLRPPDSQPLLTIFYLLLPTNRRRIRGVQQVKHLLVVNLQVGAEYLKEPLWILFFLLANLPKKVLDGSLKNSGIVLITLHSISLSAASLSISKYSCVISLDNFADHVLDA